MAGSLFHCDECQIDFNEYLDIKRHISAEHIDYFPCKCFTCKARGIKHETVTAELMYEHTSTVHEGIVPSEFTRPTADASAISGQFEAYQCNANNPNTERNGEGQTAISESGNSVAISRIQRPIMFIKAKRRRKIGRAQANHQLTIERRQLKRPKNKMRYVENLAEYQGCSSREFTRPITDASADADAISGQCIFEAYQCKANNPNTGRNGEGQTAIFESGNSVAISRIQPDNGSSRGDEPNLNVTLLENIENDSGIKTSIVNDNPGTAILNDNTERNSEIRSECQAAGENEIDLLMPSIPFTESVVETQQNVTDPITNSANTSALTAKILVNPELLEISTVPIGLRLEAALSSNAPIDVLANEAQPNSVAITTTHISRRKRSNVSSNSVGSSERSAWKSSGPDSSNGSDEYDEDEHIPVPNKTSNKPSTSRKKQSRNEFDNSCQLEANLVDSLKQSSHPASKMITESLELLPSTSASTLPAQRSSKQSSANNSNGDKNEKGEQSIQNLTAPAQVALHDPTGSIQEVKITKIWIDIGSGSTSFKTTEDQEDRQKYHNRPLCEYVSILRQSEAIRDCKVQITYSLSFPYSSKRWVRKKFEKFSEELHSISHLWVNGRVTAELCEYGNETLPLSDFCNELFGQDRSILACKVLEINSDDCWPMSVVTNVANLCNILILKEMRRHNQRLHYRLLDILYEKKLSQCVDVRLQLVYNKSTNELIGELKRRFHSQNSTVQQLKFLLVSPSKVLRELLTNKYGTGTLEINTVSSPWRDLSCVVIEQRSFTSVPDEPPT